MLIRKYRAKNLKEALQRVKADLGEEATVLSHQTVRVGLLSKQVEVTATMASISGGLLSRRPEPSASGKASSPGPESAPGGRASAPGAGLAEAMAPSMPARGYGPPPPLRRPPVKPKGKARPRPSLKAGFPLKPQPDPEMKRVISPLRKEIRALSSEIRTLTNDTESSSRIVDTLDELRQLLGAFKETPQQQQPRRDHAEILDDLVEQLQVCGMRTSLMKDVVTRVEAALPHDAEDASTCLENLAARVMAEDMRVVPALEHHSGPPRAVALVGPTGVGKTSTLIKIATRAALVQGLRVAVVAGDTHGIGAIKALSETARLIGLPCRVAETAADLSAAVAELKEQADLVLVDTGGCSGRDAMAIVALQEFLGEAAVEPMLLLNADMRCLEIDANLSGFDSMKPAALIFTKLDQAIELGGLYDAARSSSLPMMYLTNGRRIPEDIEEATPEKVAAQIMGFAYN